MMSDGEVFWKNAHDRERRTRINEERKVLALSFLACAQLILFLLTLHVAIK